MKKAKKFKIIYVYEPVHKVWVDVVMYDWNKYVKTVQKYIKDFNYQLPEKSIVE